MKKNSRKLKKKQILKMKNYATKMRIYAPK